MKKFFFIYFLLFCTFLNAIVLDLKEGWNLVYQKNSTYLDNYKISIIWGYDSVNNKWLYYLRYNPSQSTLTKTESGKGYWVYNDSGSNNSIYIIEGSYYDDNYSHLGDGWHLLATNKEITDFSDYYEDTKLIWIYKDGKWLVKGFGEEIENKINNTPYKHSKFNSIDKYAGYWILKSNNYNLPETDFTIFPQKDFYYLNEEITFKAKSDANKCTWSDNLGIQQSVSKSFTSSGSYDITLSTTAKSGKVYTTTKTIRVVDRYEEPTNNLFTQTKTYTTKDSFGDTYLYRLRREFENIILDIEYTYSDSILNRNFTLKSSYILKWNGKGFVGESYVQNHLVGSGYSNSINTSYKYMVEKRKEKIVFDFEQKTVLYKIIALEKLEVATGQNLYQYTNNSYIDGSITQNNYSYLNAIFDMQYNSAELEEIFLYDDLDIKTLLFNDLGYR